MTTGSPSVAKRRPSSLLLAVGLVLGVVVPLVTIAGVVFLGKSAPQRLEASRKATDLSVPLEGVWVAGEGSIAGYRIKEKFVGMPAPNEVVGRTEAVSARFDATRVEGGGVVIPAGSEVSVDVRELRSDQPERDNKVLNDALEVNRFPVANFVLSEPVAVGDGVADGRPTGENLKGELTLHGVTRTVSLRAQVLPLGKQIEITGSVPITLSDYEIEVLKVAKVVSSGEAGTLEFKLLLNRQEG